MSQIELYRAIIPANRIINDNHGTHYKIHQANLEWLTLQFNSIKNGYKTIRTGRGRGAHDEIVEYSAPGNFCIPDLKDIEANIKYPIKIRCEVWRPVNRRFDPQNYAKTFKAPIDLLVSNGYIQDDNWKFVDGITYVGGGPEVWNERATRFDNDGLPNFDNFIDWWNKYSENYGDILIRVIITND